MFKYLHYTNKPWLLPDPAVFRLLLLTVVVEEVEDLSSTDSTFFPRDFLAFCFSFCLSCFSFSTNSSSCLKTSISNGFLSPENEELYSFYISHQKVNFIVDNVDNVTTCTCIALHVGTCTLNNTCIEFDFVIDEMLIRALSFYILI